MIKNHDISAKNCLIYLLKTDLEDTVRIKDTEKET
jgi:hypothetical protein